MTFGRLYTGLPDAAEMKSVSRNKFERDALLTCKIAYQLFIFPNKITNFFGGGYKVADIVAKDFRWFSFAYNGLSECHNKRIFG